MRHARAAFREGPYPGIVKMYAVRMPNVAARPAQILRVLSRRQAEWARRAVHKAGLDDRVEIRVQDYRDVPDGPYDAIASVGMAEHVGAERYLEYAEVCTRKMSCG